MSKETSAWRQKTKKKVSRASQPISAKVFLLCDAVARDPSGKATLYGIFDRVWVDSLPGKLGMHNCYAVLTGDGDYTVRVVVVDPNGNELPGSDPFAAKCRPDGNFALQIVLAGIEFRKEGRHSVELRCGRRKIASYSFDVYKKPGTSPPKKRNTKKK